MVEVRNTYWANQRTDVIPEFVGSGDPPSPNTPSPDTPTPDTPIPDTPPTESAAGIIIYILQLRISLLIVFRPVIVYTGVFISLLSLLSTTLAALLL